MARRATAMTAALIGLLAAPTVASQVVNGNFDLVKDGRTVGWNPVGTKYVYRDGEGRNGTCALADSGKLSIPSGVTLAVKKATLNGVDVAPGTYATGALGGRVTGGGSLCVRGGGLLLMVW